MNREEKINKMIEEIKIRRNDEQYHGGPFPIYHIEFDILVEEVERLHSIIKEVREYIKDIMERYVDYELVVDIEYILQVLDKEK